MVPKKVYIQADSDFNNPFSIDVWQEELAKFGWAYTEIEEEADMIFRVSIKRPIPGEARLSLIIVIDNEVKWESKKIRGTSNAYHRFNPALHALRKCLGKKVPDEFR